MLTLKHFWDRYKALLIVGLGIRLVLMPFFGNNDLILTYSRSYHSAFEDGNVLQLMQFIPHLIQDITLRVISVFYDSQNFLPISLSPDVNSLANINIFIFKIPYLIFDLLAFFTLFLIVRGKSTESRSLKMYFLNPILIYAVYIFGRYETVPIFFLLLNIYLIKNNKYFLGMISLGFAFISRFSFGLLLPFYFAIIGKNWKEKFVYTFASLIPILILTIIDIYQKIQSRLISITNTEHVDFFFNTELGKVGGSSIYLFGIVFLIIFYFALRDWMGNGYSLNKLIIYSFVGLVSYYATTFYHTQYLAWIVPYVAIFDWKKERLKDLTILTMFVIFGLLLFSFTWGNEIIPKTFTPLFPSLAHADWAGNIDGLIDHVKLANIGRTIISTSFIILGIIIYKDQYDRSKISKK